MSSASSISFLRRLCRGSSRDKRICRASQRARPAPSYNSSQCSILYTHLSLCLFRSQSQIKRLVRPKTPLSTWNTDRAGDRAPQLEAPWFSSQHPHPSITPDPGALVPSSGLPGHCMHMVPRQTCRQTTTPIKQKYCILIFLVIFSRQAFSV